MAFWNKPREETVRPPLESRPALETESGRTDSPPSPPPQREESESMAMLKRDDVTTPTASNDLNALLGRGSEFEGKLTFEGTVRIDGKFTGSIVTADVLVVGEGAKVAAEITCGSIIVHGEITGNIRAKSSVELHHPAKMRGNVETPSLMIEKGVLFEGQAKMENLTFDKEKGSAKSSAPVAQPTPISAAVK
jgi:cytoskeletal protein CcmA (bactofilin family)